MVGQITAILAAENLNIEDLLNKSSGSLAYTIVDVDKEISNDVLGKISDIDGILRLRYLGI